MNRRYFRAVLSLAILVMTVSAFVYYFGHHPEVGLTLRKTSPGLLIVLLVIYSLFSGSIAMILHASLKLCKTNLGRKESLLLTMYASVVNFFGPLQSGPAFRAAYLKKKHGVSLKNYGAATLLYYASYCLANLALLFSGILGKWLILFITLISLSVFAILQSNRGERFKRLRLKAFGYLFLATMIQIALVSIIFYIELRSINPATSFSQALVYSGAANLSLFVSITPGAIGFRESFLYLSQNFHHISSSTIVTANIIDRSVYITLLLIFAVYIFSSRAVAQFKED